jgi:hypothetical protein
MSDDRLARVLAEIAAIAGAEYHKLEGVRPEVAAPRARDMLDYIVTDAATSLELAGYDLDAEIQAAVERIQAAQDPAEEVFH